VRAAVAITLDRLIGEIVWFLDSSVVENVVLQLCAKCFFKML
jgi:hypothetical protein